MAQPRTAPDCFGLGAARAGETPGRSFRGSARTAPAHGSTAPQGNALSPSEKKAKLLGHPSVIGVPTKATDEQPLLRPGLRSNTPGQVESDEVSQWLCSDAGGGCDRPTSAAGVL